ncbi:MAG: phosphoenolpyruvate carboxykinase (ATP), partial [Bacillota bacterium]
DEHNASVYLVNTGWSGGPYGVGERIKLRYTRAMVSAALKGELDKVECVPHPVFKVLVPVSVPGVPADILNPRSTWADGAEYDRVARELARKFADNFKQFTDVSAEIADAGPIVED